MAGKICPALLNGEGIVSALNDLADRFWWQELTPAYFSLHLQAVSMLPKRLLMSQSL